MNFELILKSDVKAKSSDTLYTGSYRFDRVDYVINIYEDRVRVLRKAGTKGFVINRKNAEDAIRKAYILYALQTGQGFDIKKFRYGKKSDKKLTDKDLEIYDENAGLPFVVSMMRDSMLIHDEQERSGSGIFCNEKIMKTVAGSKRYEYQGDKSMIALFAYLISRSREYEMDRFMNHYIHGSMAALIFSDVYNVNKLAIANYFMDRLITEMLPRMCDGVRMYQELLQIHDHHFTKLIRRLKNDQNCKDKNGQDKAQKAKQSLAELQKIKGLITAGNKSLAWLKKSI